MLYVIIGYVVCLLLCMFFSCLCFVVCLLLKICLYIYILCVIICCVMLACVWFLLSDCLTCVCWSVLRVNFMVRLVSFVVCTCAIWIVLFWIVFVFSVLVFVQFSFIWFRLLLSVFACNSPCSLLVVFVRLRCTYHYWVRCVSCFCLFLFICCIHFPQMNVFHLYEFLLLLSYYFLCHLCHVFVCLSPPDCFSCLVFICFCCVVLF